VTCPARTPLAMLNRQARCRQKVPAEGAGRV